MEHTAYQFRLYPNKEQKELFAKTFGCVRFIWNQMLADEQYFYDATDTFFIPTPAKYKKLYQEISAMRKAANAGRPTYPHLLETPGKTNHRPTRIRDGH